MKVIHAVIHSQGCISTNSLGRIRFKAKCCKDKGNNESCLFESRISFVIMQKHLALCMFVQFLHNHNGDSYCMYNPKTNWIKKMRDVVLLKCIYYQKQETL